MPLVWLLWQERPTAFMDLTLSRYIHWRSRYVRRYHGFLSIWLQHSGAGEISAIPEMKRRIQLRYCCLIHPNALCSSFRILMMTLLAGYVIIVGRMSWCQILEVMNKMVRYPTVIRTASALSPEYGQWYVIERDGSMSVPDYIHHHNPYNEKGHHVS
jgi:hypothetical protein